MKAYRAKERRLRKRYQALTHVYIGGMGARRFWARNHSVDGVFIELRGDELRGLGRGSMLELVFVVDHGSLARLYRRRARVSHVNAHGVGLQLCRD